MNAHVSKILFVFAIGVAMSLGCSTNGGTAAASEPSEAPEPTPSEVRPAKGPSPQEAPNKSAVTKGRAVIHAEDARAGGLPAVGFTVEWDTTPGFSPRMPLGGGMYLSLSGPPGGPLGMRVSSYTNGDADHATLEKNISVPQQFGYTKGAPEQVSLAGASRPALAYLSGQAIAKVHGCAVLVPARAGAREGLVVTFISSGHSVTQPNCATVLANPSLTKLVATFRLH